MNRSQERAVWFKPAEPLACASPGVSACELETRFCSLELAGVVSGSQKKVAAVALPSVATASRG